MESGSLLIRALAAERQFGCLNGNHDNPLEGTTAIVQARHRLALRTGPGEELPYVFLGNLQRKGKMELCGQAKGLHLKNRFRCL